MANGVGWVFIPLVGRPVPYACQGGEGSSIFVSATTVIEGVSIKAIRYGITQARTPHRSFVIR